MFLGSLPEIRKQQTIIAQRRFSLLGLRVVNAGAGVEPENICIIQMFE